MHIVHRFCEVAVYMAAGVTLIAAAVAPGTDDVGLAPVLTANPKMAGMAPSTILAPELVEVVLVQGATPLENGTKEFPFYGYNGDGPMLPAPGDVQSVNHNVEATKTKPDKNTYLVLQDQDGLVPCHA